MQNTIEIKTELLELIQLLDSVQEKTQKINDLNKIEGIIDDSNLRMTMSVFNSQIWACSKLIQESNEKIK